MENFYSDNPQLKFHLTHPLMAKIVKLMDMQTYKEEMLQKVWGLGGKIIESVEYAVENEENAETAMKLLEGTGIIAGSKGIQVNVSQANQQITTNGNQPKDEREERLMKLATQMARGVLERVVIYEQPLPDMDLTAEEIKTLKEK